MKSLLMIALSVVEVSKMSEDSYATENWVRAYIDEAASVDLKSAKETYEKFLRQREILMHDVNEERKTHHQTAQSMAHTNEALRQENKKLVGIIEELSGKMIQLKADMEHVRADSIIRFSSLRADLEELDNQVDANRRKLHRQEQVEWEKKTQEESVRSADES